ncbi:response regulator [candidate division KSB1 bacterium]|nr:response regulator [candidate division KSB1 bacterium]
MNKILLVDDEKHILQDLGNQLRNRKYAIYTVSSLEDAKKIILCENLDFAIIDLKLDFTSEFSGIKIVNYAKRNRPEIKTLILSAYPFEDVKEQLKQQLSGQIEPGKILDEIEKDYISKGGKKNYILAIIEKLEELKHKEKRKTCFVIMPFSATPSCTKQQWLDIFKNLIKPAVEESGYEYECIRSEPLVGNIIENMLDKLNRADIVIADLTDKNPNVFYELGVRHALRNLTILIAQNVDDVPFDLRPYATQIYDWKTTDGRHNFKEQIKLTIKLLEENPNEAVSPVRKYLRS